MSPRAVALEDAEAWGLPCRRARDLVIQDHDDAGAVWASRGHELYRLPPGGDAFEPAGRVPTGANAHALRGLRLVRDATQRPDCLEALPLPDGRMLAVSAGRIWLREADRFEPVFTLQRFGVGVGRGVLSPGVARLSDGTLALGEYWRNPDEEACSLFASDASGRSWRRTFTFPARGIRHVHAIQEDPFTGDVWIATGDLAEECLIGRLRDGLSRLDVFRRGGPQHQQWRAAQLVFTERAIHWGADTRYPSESGLYRYDRGSGHVEKLASVPGAILHATRLTDGTLAFATDRAGRAGRCNEHDDRLQLWLVRKERNVRWLPLGHRRLPRVGRRAAVLRLARHAGLPSLWVTPISSDHFSGDLLAFESDALWQAATPPDGSR